MIIIIIIDAIETINKINKNQNIDKTVTTRVIKQSIQNKTIISEDANREQLVLTLTLFSLEKSWLLALVKS